MDTLLLGCNWADRRPDESSGHALRGGPLAAWTTRQHAVREVQYPTGFGVCGSLRASRARRDERPWLGPPTWWTLGAGIRLASSFQVRRVCPELTQWSGEAGQPGEDRPEPLHVVFRPENLVQAGLVEHLPGRRGLLAQRLPEIGAGVPGHRRGGLYQRISVLSGHTSLDQVEQGTGGVDQATGGLQVGPHPGRVHHQAADQGRGLVQQVVGQY